MTEPNFTLEAYDALRHASREAERYGDVLVTPDHLLLALLRGEETGAVRVLAHFKILPPPLIARLERYLSWSDCEEQAAIRLEHARKADAPSVGEMLPRVGVILDHARAEAKHHGRPVIGTEHLLFGVLREGGSLGAWLLMRHGLYAVPLSEELAVRLPEVTRTGAARMRTTEAQTRASRSVFGVAALGIWSTILALCFLVALLVPVLEQSLELSLKREFWFGLARAVWVAGLALSSVRPGLRLERRVWPRMQALLFTSGAGAAAVLTAAITGLAPSLTRTIPPLAFYLALVGYTTYTMFRSRTEFGVEAREGWRTLWREGGGYLLVGTVLELATLVCELGRS